MKFNPKLRAKIFNKTNGACHICRKKLKFENYGKRDKKDGWEVEHSIPRAKGGTDHLNNLLPAHGICNKMKGKEATSEARANYGYKYAPYSKDKKITNAWSWGAIGTMAGFFVPPPYRLVVTIVGATLGSVLGYNSEPD